MSDPFDDLDIKNYQPSVAEMVAEVTHPLSPRAFTDALLADIKDELVQANVYLRLLAADAERRNLPFVFVPEGEEQWPHHKDRAEQLLAERDARAAEIALVQGNG